MDRSQTRTDNQTVMPRRDSRGMEMIRATQPAVNPTLYDFSNADTNINTNVNAADVVQQQD